MLYMLPHPDRALVACMGLLLAACTTDATRDGDVGVMVDVPGALDALDAGDAGDGTGADSQVGPLQEAGCPSGHAAFPTGDDGVQCVSVGPAGYHALLYEATDPWLELGLPEPGTTATVSSCDARHAPAVVVDGETESCLLTEPAGCAAAMRDDDGRCAPSVSSCPPGSIPALAKADGDGPPDAAGCLSIDGSSAPTPAGCGDGPWGDLEELAGDQHVDPATPQAPADGSRESPWPTVALALQSAAPVGRVVLAKGSHAAGVESSAGETVHVVGACAAEVILTGTVSTDIGPSVLAAAGSAALHVEGVTLAGAGFGVLATDGASVTLERVVVRDAAGLGLVALGQGSLVAGANVLVTGSQALPSGSFGEAVHIEAGGRVTLTGSGLIDAQNAAVVVVGSGSTFEGHGVIIEDPIPSPAGTGGRGIEVRDGATLALTDSAIVGAVDVATNLRDTGTSATLQRVLIAGTHRTSSGLGGHGLSVGVDAAGPVVTATGLSLLANGGAGLVASGAGTLVDTEAVLIASGESSGVHAQQGASVTLDAVLVRRATGRGLVVDGLGTDVAATHLTVEETALADAGDLGVGVEVRDGGRLELSRAVLRDNRTAGLAVNGAGSHAEVGNLLVSGTRPRSDGTWGRGIEVATGATLALSSATLSDNRELGLAVSAGSSVEAQALVIEGTRANPTQPGGWGVAVQPGASLSLVGAALLDNQELGLSVTGPEASLGAEGVLIADTQPLDDALGRGLSVLAGGTAEVSALALIGNHDIGLAAAHPGTDVSAAGLLVQGTRPLRGGIRGVGVVVQEGATLTVDDAVVRDNVELGLAALEDGARVVATGLVVEGTEARALDGDGGAGVWAQFDAELTLRHSLIRDNHLAAVRVLTASAVLEDTVLKGTASGSQGNAVNIADGLNSTESTVSLARVLARGCERAGFAFRGSAGEATGLVATGNGTSLLTTDDVHPSGDELVFVEELFLDDVPRRTAGALDFPDGPMEVPAH